MGTGPLGDIFRLIKALFVDGWRLQPSFITNGRCGQ